MTHQILLGIARALFFTGLAALLLARAVSHPLSHDEHQFLSAGWLLADQGLLPYRDFAYMHTPYQSFAYAPWLVFLDRGLLTARVVNALTALLTLMVLYKLVRGWFRSLEPVRGHLVATAAVLALVGNPLFAITSGKAWNHDLPTLLTLLSLALLLGSGPLRGKRRFGLAGALAGLTVGTRLSYAPAALVLAAGVLFLNGPVSLAARARRALTFMAGGVLALSPIVVLFALSARGFIFGNWVYPRLNTLYRQALGHRVAMTSAGKLEFLARELWEHPIHLVTLGVFLLVLVWPILRKSRHWAGSRASGLFAVLTISLVAGSFAPTPTWRHYLYAPVPFVVLGAFYGLARLTDGGRGNGWGLRALTLLGLLTLLTVLAPEFVRAGKTLRSPRTWTPNRVHDLGLQVAARVGEGPVLTLAPIVPLEGGRTIYPDFASGPFVWRTAHLVSAERRAEYSLTGREELGKLLARQPPGAVLVGFESTSTGFEPGDAGGLERALVEYARVEGYRPEQLPFGDHVVELWLP